ncbi:unnamed protein product [Urochloa humidicola]
MNKLKWQLLGVLDFAFVFTVDHHAYNMYREHLEDMCRDLHHALPGATPTLPTRTATAHSIVKLLSLLALAARDCREERVQMPAPNSVLTGEESNPPTSSGSVSPAVPAASCYSGPLRGLRGQVSGGGESSSSGPQCIYFITWAGCHPCRRRRHQSQKVLS